MAENDSLQICRVSQAAVIFVLRTMFAVKVQEVSSCAPLTLADEHHRDSMLCSDPSLTA
jgi:hypothetical protein